MIKILHFFKSCQKSYTLRCFPHVLVILLNNVTNVLLQRICFSHEAIVISIEFGVSWIQVIIRLGGGYIFSFFENSYRVI